MGKVCACGGNPAKRVSCPGRVRWAQVWNAKHTVGQHQQSGGAGAGVEDQGGREESYLH